MDRQTTRKVRYFVGLHYPMKITATEQEFSGCFPDLPGCGCTHPDLSTLYSSMEQRRREWIAEHLLAGQQIPMPNSHLAGESTPLAFRPLFCTKPVTAEC